MRIVAWLGVALLATASGTERARADASPPAPRAADATPTRVYSDGMPTWIFAEPARSANAIGYIRLGQSVALRDAEKRKGPGCPGGFVAVEPFGYVCLDRTATLDASTRYLRSMRRLAPRPGALPFHYALSNGTPMYRRLPSRAEWEREERFLGAPGTFGELSIGNRGHERLAESRVIEPRSKVPTYFRDGGSVSSAHPLELVRRHIPLGSMLAYTTAFEHEGRTFLMSADGTAVPADRVRPFRETSFHGVELRDGLDLPIAWMRKQARPEFVLEEGRFVPTGHHWPARSFAPIDTAREPQTVDGVLYLPTLETRTQRPLWVRASDATLAERADKLPWGVGEHDQWIVVSITRGTLVAYEGRTPVFATLISPGAGGVPVRGKDPVKMSTTPMGGYRVTFKHAAQTMSPEEGEERSFWIADVPHTQYFNAPFALHTAYWHDDFGEPMSAGCINLSPVDGKWLFDWSTPRLPPGWGGVGPHRLTGVGTHVVVRR